MERLTGYQRDEVLHKKLEEILLPIDSIPLWKNLLESIRQNMWVDEFVLPLKTKQNQSYMITWTGFFIKDEHGSFKDICLIGKPVKQEVINKQFSDIFNAVPEISPEPKIQLNAPEPMSKSENREIPMKHGRKKILFANEKKAEIGHADDAVQEHFIKPVEIKGRIDEKTSEKYNSMDESFKESAGKYGTVLKRLEELETKDHRVKKKDKNLGRYPQLHKEKYRQHEEKQKDPNHIHVPSDKQQTKNRMFSNLFGFTRQRRELMEQKQQLDLRSKELDALQSQLLKEQNTFNIRVEEFSKWRQKLEQLESAIEKRRQELMRQEDIILEKSMPINAQRIVTVKQVTPKNIASEAPKNEETLNKIPHSAALIQRGILKQINTLFLELLGYTMEEIVEKSYFDFIALEGLADVEKYYLDRLKGDNVSVYKTVFETKDNHKISAEVSIKQTIYNGEKAEIAIITCLDSNKS